MKNNFVEDGRWRLLFGQKNLSKESIRKKFETELAAASPEQKQKVQKQIQEEFLRQQNHRPSAKSLW